MSTSDVAPDKATQHSPAMSWKVAAASLFGTTAEYYDFLIFSTAAALVFPKLFFPAEAPTAATLATFATFAVGFVARPLGGVVFSHFGDRVGRKAVLIVTLVLMGLCTVAIGLLPTYATAGILAPILLVVLRLLQGLAVGGEWGGAVLVTFEHAAKGRRGLLASIPQLGTVTGVLIGSLAFILVGRLPEPDLLSWGWRIPFLAGGVILVIGLILRLSITESQEFNSVKQAGRTARLPIREVFRAYPRQIFLSIGSVLGVAFGGFTLTVYLLNYATTTQLTSSATMLVVISVCNVAQLVAIPLAGVLSDRFGRYPVVAGGAIALGLGSLLAPSMLATGEFLPILVLYVVTYVVGVSFQIGVIPALIAETFPTAVRYTGASLGYQLGSALAGFGPFMFTLLFSATGTIYVVPIVLVVLMVITIVCSRRLDRSNTADPDRTTPGPATVRAA